MPAQQKSDQGRLSRTGRTNDGHVAARRHVKIDLLQDSVSCGAHRHGIEANRNTGGTILAAFGISASGGSAPFRDLRRALTRVRILPVARGRRRVAHRLRTVAQTRLFECPEGLEQP